MGLLRRVVQAAGRLHAREGSGEALAEYGARLSDGFGSA